MKYDRVAQIRIDGQMIRAFELCATSKKPIRYYEDTNQSDVGMYNIIDAKAGLSGYINFYLKRV